MISYYLFRICPSNPQPFPSKFSLNVAVITYVDPPKGVQEHTKSVKVILIRLWRTINVYTILTLIREKKWPVAKGVPRMMCGRLPLQYWTLKPILPVSCGRIHHKGSLNRTKVVLICKLCFVIHIWPLINMKLISNMVINSNQHWKCCDYTNSWDNHTV